MENQAPIYGPYVPRILFEILISERGCGRTYNKLMNYNMNILKDIKEKWENILDNNLLYDIIERAFRISTYENRSLSKIVSVQTTSQSYHY